MKKLLNFLIFVACLWVWCVGISAQSNKQIETKMLGHLEKLEKAAYRTGTGDSTILERENRILKQALLKYGTRSTMLEYDFPAISSRMIIATSKDKKLRTYSWDDQQGGSGRIYETVFQYKDAKGKTHTWSDPATMEGVVCTGFIHGIFQADTNEGRIYLLNSTSTCSNPLAYQDLSIYRIDGVKLNRKLKLINTGKRLTNSVGFEYDFFSVVDRKERPIKLFIYDEEKQSFRFPVVVADPKFINGGRVTDKFITYKWDGRYFRRVR